MSTWTDRGMISERTMRKRQQLLLPWVAQVRLETQRSTTRKRSVGIATRQQITQKVNQKTVDCSVDYLVYYGIIKLLIR